MNGRKPIPGDSSRPGEPGASRRGFLARLAGLAGGGWVATQAPRAFASPAEAQAGTPFVGEISMVAFNFAPIGWLKCDGQLLPIAEYETLFQLIGTTFGGDGQETFAVPDLRGRLPIHAGPGLVLGESGGDPFGYVLASQLPAHTHALLADPAVGTSATPQAAMSARDPAKVPGYGASSPQAMSGAAILAAGGGQPHENMPPYLGVHFIIATEGIYPPLP